MILDLLLDGDSITTEMVMHYLLGTYVAPLHESVRRMLYHNMSLSMTLSFILRCIKPLLYFFVPIHQSITKRANCGNSDNGEVMLVISTDITENVNNDGTCSNKCSNCSKINVLRHL